MSHIHENEFANRYLAGKLSDAERAAYEPDVAGNEDTLRELEATARLKVGLARLRESGELEDLLSPPAWTRLRPALAVAAMFGVLAIGILLIRLGGDRGRTTTAPPLLAASATLLTDAQGTALPVARTLAVFRKRVQGADATLEVAATPQVVELRVLPETTVASETYQVTLARMSEGRAAEPVASIPGLQPAADGFLDVFVDASRLSAGPYQLDVLGAVSDGSTVAAGTFRLQVEPPKTQ
jgi:hypothetical protein